MCKLNTSAIIVSAGSSSRMNGINKQLEPIFDIPVIIRSILAFENCEEIKEIIVVTRKCDIEIISKMIDQYMIKKVKNIIEGGATRQQSVFNGLKLLSDDTKLVAIHDGARPLVITGDISQCIKDASVFGGATLGVPVKDTVKVVSDRLVVDTPDRSSLFIIQTPQVFKKDIYFRAVNFANEHNLDFTDDCQLVEAMGIKIYIADGKYTNIKITTPEDIAIAEAIVKYSECEGD